MDDLDDAPEVDGLVDGDLVEAARRQLSNKLNPKKVYVKDKHVRGIARYYQKPAKSRGRSRDKTPGFQGLELDGIPDVDGLAQGHLFH